MTLPSLISFSGYATVGKDAAADILVSRAGFVKTYMSKPLEQALLTLNPWIVDHKESTIERFADLHTNLGYDATKEFEEVRRLLQTLGTEVGRNMVGENVWTDLVFDEILNLRAQDKNVAVTGVRYPNEMDLVHQLDGVAVWIERPNIRPVNSHTSDNALTSKDCDLVVSNNGTLRNLYVNLVTGLEEYNAKKDNHE